MITMARLLVPVSLIVLLGACTSPPGTIMKMFSLDSGMSVTTGSRQRAITNISIRDTSRPGLVDPTRIVCAEPSPDVAIAVANSFGIGISVLGKGSGAISAAQAEGLAQLAERTVTVQLLRDQMFRACEAYANGAITGTTYSLIMSKNNDAMVTLMLGEVAGGAFGRSLAAIGTAASAEAQAKLAGLANNSAAVKQAAADLRKADEEVKEAEEKLRLLEKSEADDEAKTGTAAVNDLTKEKNRMNVEDAEGELAEAKATRDAIAARLNSSVEATAKASAEVTKLTAAGGIDQKASPEVASVLREMQGQYLETDFNDEYVSACLVELGLETIPNKLEEGYLRSVEVLLHNFGDDLLSGTLSRDAARNLAELRNVFDDSVHRNRSSRLANHCRKNLFSFIMTAHSDRVELKSHELELQKQSGEIKKIDATTRNVTALNQAVAACKSLENTDQAGACIDMLMKVRTGAAGPIEVKFTRPVDGVVLRTITRPLVAFNAAKKAEMSLKALQAKVTTALPPVQGADKQARKDRLVARQNALKAAISELFKISDPALANPVRVQIVALEDQRTALEIEFLSTDKADKLTREIIESQLKQQQLRAMKRKADFELLRDQLSDLTMQSKTYLEDAKSL